MRSGYQVDPKVIANNDQITIGNGQNTAKTPMAGPVRPAGAERSAGLAAGGVVQGSGSEAEREENQRKD